MTLFMSCDTTTVVMLNSRVRSPIKLSMTMAVCGSRPELGSSQNRYLGFMAMARAMPTRFCMPPLSSEGYLSAEAGNSTRSRQKDTRSCMSDSDMSLNIRSGNITFSDTVMLSNRALP